MSFLGISVSMRIADCRRAILAAVAAITCSLASPVHAQERPTVLPECAPGVLTLASAFIPQTTTGSLQNLVDEWLNEAAAVPPGKAAAAYRNATRNAIAALKQAGVSVTERDILIYRFTSLKTWRADIKPPILAGGGPFAPLAAIDRELDLIASLLPAACRI
jgi:hypothetical protein